MITGFGHCGVPENLLRGLNKLGTKDLTIISGTANTDDWGLGWLLKGKQVRRIVTSYIGENEICIKQFLDGTLEVRGFFKKTFIIL